MYRRDHRLTGRSLLRGIVSRPSILWTYPLGAPETSVFLYPRKMDLRFAYGGCVVLIIGQKWFVRGVTMTGLKE